MKNLLILIATILFGISATFAQGVNIVNVSWDQSECECEGTISGSYFKVQVSVYDNANNQWVVQNKIVNTTDAATNNADVDVPEVGEYCDDPPANTPSFTVYATVTLMCEDTNPPTAVCSGTGNSGTWDCHDFYDDNVPCSVGDLN